MLPKGSPSGLDRSGASRSGRPSDGERSTGIGRESRSLLAPLDGIRDFGRLVNLEKKEGDCCKEQPSLGCAMFWLVSHIRSRSEFGDIRIGCSRGAETLLRRPTRGVAVPFGNPSTLAEPPHRWTPRPDVKDNHS
jgi:hypothetical protein